MLVRIELLRDKGTKITSDLFQVSSSPVMWRPPYVEMSTIRDGNSKLYGYQWIPEMEYRKPEKSKDQIDA